MTVDRKVVRTWRRGSVAVATLHPQFGTVDRGHIVPVWDASYGAYMAWQLVSLDFEWFELLVVGDYLSAEGVLLDRTAWADERVPAHELDD